MRGLSVGFGWGHFWIHLGRLVLRVVVRSAETSSAGTLFIGAPSAEWVLQGGGLLGFFVRLVNFHAVYGLTWTFSAHACWRVPRGFRLQICFARLKMILMR